jgi:hypothetical protein
MEWGDEEAAQESIRRGAWQAGRFGPELGQKAGQSRKRAHKWPGIKRRKQGLRPGARPDAHDPDAERRVSRGSCGDSVAFRIRRY